VAEMILLQFVSVRPTDGVNKFDFMFTT